MKPLAVKASFLSASFLSIGLFVGLTSSPVRAADFTSLSSSDDFYNYYGDGFSTEAKTVINDLYSNLTPYFGVNGLEKAATDGFAPMTPEAKAHGTHWFRPDKVYDFVAEATRPTGLNFDENDQLVAVYWGESKYAGIEEAAQGLLALPPESVPAAYTNYKATSRRDVPSILEPFGSLVSWHSHENVRFDNVGARNPETGAYDAEAVDFGQSLTDEAFVSELLQSLQNEDEFVAPFEVNPTTYPPYNTAMHPGFYMAHLWVGAGNPEGAFNGEHAAVSPNGIEEHTTFEDGSVGGHSGTPGHGGGVPGHSGVPGHGGTPGHGEGDVPGHGGTPAQSVPEPTGLIGLGVLGLLGLKQPWSRNRV